MASLFPKQKAESGLGLGFWQLPSKATTRSPPALGRGPVAIRTHGDSAKAKARLWTCKSSEYNCFQCENELFLFKGSDLRQGAAFICEARFTATNLRGSFDMRATPHVTIAEDHKLPGE